MNSFIFFVLVLLVSGSEVFGFFIGPRTFDVVRSPTLEQQHLRQKRQAGPYGASYGAPNNYYRQQQAYDDRRVQDAWYNPGQQAPQNPRRYPYQYGPHQIGKYKVLFLIQF